MLFRSKIDLVGPYNPTWLGNVKRSTAAKPADLADYASPIFPVIPAKGK